MQPLKTCSQLGLGQLGLGQLGLGQLGLGHLGQYLQLVPRIPHVLGPSVLLVLRRKQLLVRFSLASVCGLEEITETLFSICCQCWLAAVALGNLGFMRLVTFDNHNDEIQ